MSVYVFLNLGSSEVPPNYWSSQGISRIANGKPEYAARQLPAALTAAIESLTRIVESDEEPFVSFMARDPSDERRQLWEQWHAEREPAWQAPSTLSAHIDTVLLALRTDSRPFSACGIIDENYTAADFEQDLAGLRANLVWAESRGIPRVRLEAG